MEKTNAEELGLISKEDVRKEFDKLLPWDKKELAEELAEVYNISNSDDDDYEEHPTVWEFVSDHDTDDILKEMSFWEIMAHLRDYYIFEDIIRFLVREGKSSYKLQGYSKEEFLEAIEKILKEENA